MNGLGQLLADAGHLGQLINPGFFHLLQSPQVFEQRLTTLGPDAGNILQAAAGAGLGAASTVPGDGKTVGFIANVLDEMQGGHIRRQVQLFVALPHDQGLQPGLARHPLGDTHQQGVFATEKLQLASQDLLGAAQLAEAAVDKEDVGHLVRLLRLAKAALQRLLHGGIVIPPRDAVDIEAAIFGRERPLPVEHHTRSDGALPHGVRDIEALHAGDGGLQLQQLLQLTVAGSDGALVGQARAQGRLGIDGGQLDEAGPLGAGTAHHPHLVASSLA